MGVKGSEAVTDAVVMFEIISFTVTLSEFYENLAVVLQSPSLPRLSGCVLDSVLTPLTRVKNPLFLSGIGLIRRILWSLRSPVLNPVIL